MIMDENTIENIRYKLELKKLIGDETLPSDVNKTEIRSDPWVDDLELLTSTPISEPPEDKSDKDLSYSALYGKDNEESKLIEENIDLYDDLIKIEEEERKAKQMHEMEFQNCKKELKRFQELDVKNKAKIEELTKENINLKKSISSLYRTFKREIDFKDNSLAEANNEITRLTSLTYRKNGQILKNEKCSNCENTITDLKRDATTSKRKRSESPEHFSNKKDFKSGTSKMYERDLQSEKNKRRTDERPYHRTRNDKHISHLQNNNDKNESFHKQILNDLQHDKETQTTNQCVFCLSRENSNEMLFNLLPDSLKKSIHDYEQDQVSALKKLKEALINQYFNSEANVPSSISESIQKKQNILVEESILNKSSDTLLSPGTVSTPTFSSEPYRETEFAKKDELHENERTPSTRTFSSELCKETESAKRAKKHVLDVNEAKNDCAQNNDSKKSKKYDPKLNKKEESISNKNSDNIPLSRLPSTPTTSFERCKRTELARKYENDKNEPKKGTVQNEVCKEPKNCYTSRQIKREEAISSKNSENVSSSTNDTMPSSSSQHLKTAESDRRFTKNVLDTKKSKRDRSRRRDPRISKNYYPRQSKKDVISLFHYRKQKAPFEVKKKFELHKDDQKMTPKHLL